MPTEGLLLWLAVVFLLVSSSVMDSKEGYSYTWVKLLLNVMLSWKIRKRSVIKLNQHYSQEEVEIIVFDQCFFQPSSWEFHKVIWNRLKVVLLTWMCLYLQKFFETRRQGAWLTRLKNRNESPIFSIGMAPLKKWNHCKYMVIKILGRHARRQKICQKISSTNCCPKSFFAEL